VPPDHKTGAVINGRLFKTAKLALEFHRYYGDHGRYKKSRARIINQIDISYAEELCIGMIFLVIELKNGRIFRESSDSTWITHKKIRRNSKLLGAMLPKN
jgi:hypothetical protein